MYNPEHGKPIIHELHVDIFWPTKGSIMHLDLPSVPKHESWRTKESLELEKKLVNHFLPGEYRK